MTDYERLRDLLVSLATALRDDIPDAIAKDDMEEADVLCDYWQKRAFDVLRQTPVVLPR